jgi:hypothetical protein
VTAATKARHLHAVTDTEQPTARPGPGITAIAEAHDAACGAALETDVTDQQQVLIAKAMTALAAPGVDFHAVLRDYGRDMFVIGHIDGFITADEPADTAPLAARTLAKVFQLEAAARFEVVR